MRDVPNILSGRNFREIVNTFLYIFLKKITKTVNNDTMLIIAFFLNNLIIKYGSTYVYALQEKN